VRLVSWNIHGGVGRDGQRDLGRIASAIQATNCDVAALQEVGNPHVPAQDGEVRDQTLDLARRLGWTAVFGPNLILHGKPYGNALLTRFPILLANNYDLSVRGREPRGCLRVDVELPGGTSLHVFNLHLGLSTIERRRQEAMLLSADLLHDIATDAPLVICGDFNTWSPLKSRLLRVVRGELRDAAVLAGARRPTWPALLPFLRLDRAYVDHAVHVLGCGVVNDASTRSASDHLPLWLDLAPRAPAPALAVAVPGA
jgi:endonuclease/exonuclease/phosphatase family metal-dependent hydrolase